MQIEDGNIGVYVGLNADGEVVQTFATVDDFENREDTVVSIGFVDAIIIDYDEIYNVTGGD